jgi:hypothetical protein
MLVAVCSSDGMLLEHYLCDYMMYGMIDPLFGGALLDHQFV